MSFRASTNQTAVSPVIAVILLVAVTVTLSAVIGGFALNLGQSTTSSTSQQSVGVSTSQSDGTFTATVVTGSADKANLLVNGTVVDNVSNPSAGDTLSGNISTDSDVTIVTVTDGDSTVVSSTTISQSTATTTTAISGPTDGLVARWKLNDGPSDSVNGHNGTNNGVTFVNDSYRGGVGHFVGSENDYIDIASPAGGELNPDTITVSVWVNTSADVKNGIVNKNDGGMTGGAKVYQIVNDGNGDWRYQIWDSTGTTYKIKTPVVTGEWKHLVLTYNNTTLRAYVNGTLVNETSAGGNPLLEDDAPLWLGQHYDTTSGWTFGGDMDDVRIYNRTLTKSEVGDLYNATK